MAAKDPFVRFGPGLIGPARGMETVTPSDDTDLQNVSRAVYASVTGNLAVVMADGSEGTIENFPASTMFSIRVTRIKATGTTATGIKSFY